MGIAAVGRYLWRWLKGKITGLTHLKDRPHAIALGVASGTFFCFITLFGFKTLLAMAIARLTRGPVVAAAVAVTLHDVILPIMPVLLHWEYHFGYWLLSHPHHFPAPLNMGKLSASMMFNWSTLFSVGLPLILGSVLVAIPFTLGSYFLALRMVSRHQEKQKKLVVIPGQLPESERKKPVVP